MTHMCVTNETLSQQCCNTQLGDWKKYIYKILTIRNIYRTGDIQNDYYVQWDYKHAKLCVIITYILYILCTFRLDVKLSNHLFWKLKVTFASWQHSPIQNQITLGCQGAIQKLDGNLSLVPYHSTPPDNHGTLYNVGENVRHPPWPHKTHKDHLLSYRSYAGHLLEDIFQI